MFKRVIFFAIAGIILTQTASAKDIFKMNASERARLCRCTPEDHCWPTAKVWKGLQAKISGRLSPYSMPGDDGKEVSGYTLAAETAKDIGTVIKFARNHKLKLANEKRDPLTADQAPATNGLMIVTRKLRSVSSQENFTPKGCSSHDYNMPAVTVGAGANWSDVYNEVTTKQHRYIQGSSYSSLGPIDYFTQGGGFGSFSKKFGTAAANVLQAELVTANGDILTVNDCQNPDLFWAIRGGGARTFGIVTSMTFATYPAPKIAGIYQANIQAKTDEAYRVLLEQYLVFFRQYLNNDHWGEKFSFNKDNQINISLAFQDLDEADIAKTWQPFTEWLMKNANLYTMQSEVLNIPADKIWNKAFLEKKYPSLTLQQPSTTPIQTWWMPLNLFEDENVKMLADRLFKASRVTAVNFQMSKGLAGASVDAMQRTSETSMNPNVLQAAALVVMRADDNADAKTTQQITQAMSLFKQAAPNAGTYINEADNVGKNWQSIFWGENYPRLLVIKQKYDLQGMFYCEQCVGSENWQVGGVCLA